MISKQKAKKNISETGRIYVSTTFNNTIVTLTNEKGDTIAWSSSGNVNFKGTRKATPYAASLAAEEVIKKAKENQVKTVEVFIKGPGVGRDAVLRSIRSSGLSVAMIADVTPMPHNGARAGKKRRI